jgi:small subunit ribosomal protein S7
VEIGALSLALSAFSSRIFILGYFLQLYMVFRTNKKEPFRGRVPFFSGVERRELNAGLRWKDFKRVKKYRLPAQHWRPSPRMRVVGFKPYSLHKGDVSSYTSYLGDYYTSVSNRMVAARKDTMKRIFFESRVIKLFIGNLIHAGGRQKAIRVFRSFLFSLAKSEFFLNGNYQSPMHAVFGAVRMVSPRVVLCSKRVGGVVYRLPIFVARDRRSYSFGVRWIVQAAKKRSGGSMSSRLVSEICDLFEKKGAAYKRKIELYSVAVSNKPFLHYLRRRKRRGRLLARLNRK